MALIMNGENEPEKCILNQHTCTKDIESSHLLPLSSQGNAISSSAEVESGCVYPGIEQGDLNETTSNHGYMYLGYDETCHQWDNQPYFVSQERLLFQHSGVQAENDSSVYCMPSHITYAPGQVMAFEEQSCLQQPYLSSAGYFQQNVSNLSETMPVYSWDSKLGAEDMQANPKIGNVLERKALSSVDAGPSNSEDLKPIKSDIKHEIRTSLKPLESKTHLLTSSSDFSVRSVKPLKMQPAVQPVRYSQGYHHSTQISSSSCQEQKFPFARNAFSGSRSMYPTVNDNYHYQTRDKSNLNKNCGVPNELLRGPRATRLKPSSSSSAEKDSLNTCARREEYNKPDFQVKYEHAKFFMIKSYSEDDIHKSIKYSVWASTPNGNNKLDDAFRKAEMEKIEKGIICPIFLFFSVNASGQFVGLAEITGPFDFKKSMDFWQQDKWNGFFPVKWHIIKDIPNKNFQHITLENNDNRVVTFSRDTQEIKLPQGLSMLQIFKAYQSATSMLDDFDCYEEKEKEKSLRASRSNQPALTHSNVDLVDNSSLKHLESSFGDMSLSARPRKSYAASQYPSSNLTRGTYAASQYPSSNLTRRPYAASQYPSSNLIRRPYAASQYPSSNLTRRPYAASQYPSSNLTRRPYADSQYPSSTVNSRLPVNRS